MKRNLWIGISVVVIVALAIVLFITQTKKEPEVIKIGAILPLTGELASHGEDAKKGIDLAVEIINEQGGVRSHKVFVTYEDDRMQPKEGVSAFLKLVTTYKVQVVLGGIGSSVALAIAPIAQENNVVFLSPTASHSRLPLVGNYIFRIWSSDIFEGKKMSENAYNKLNLKKIAILFVNNDFGQGISEIFTGEFERLGGVVVSKDSYEQGDTDFRAHLHRIKELKPDAVYLPGYYQEVAKILKQAKELNINSQFLSTTPVENPKLLELAGNSAEGLIYTRPSFDPKNPSENYIKFVNLYRSKYHIDPGVAAAYSYDAINIILQSIEQGGFRSSEIRDAIAQIKDYPGVTGKISFDDNGDVIREFVLFTIRNGKFVRY